MTIKDIHAKVILDSRGEKTIEAQLQTENFSVKTSVPSGKSKGENEVKYVDPTIAIEKLEMIKHHIVGHMFQSQKAFDNRLIELDGTKDKSNLGGNLILALSLAFAKASAKYIGKQLWEYVNDVYKENYGPRKTNFPYLMFNVINGGVHSSPSERWIMRNGSPKLSIQEFQIIPMTKDIAVALGMGEELYKKLREKLVSRFGKENVEMGDEAGFIAPFENDDDALDTLYELTREYNYPARIGIDVAATQIFENEKYNIDGKEYSAIQLIEYYKKIVNRYNIISIEDPFMEEDFNSFSRMKSDFDKESLNTVIITDDLTATNPKRIEKAVEVGAGNALLVKPNQIGTLTETLKAVAVAYSKGWDTVSSHRSGETTDNFIADIAVGIGSWGLKAGAPNTIFRMSKYERIVEIYQSAINSHII